MFKVVPSKRGVYEDTTQDVVEERLGEQLCMLDLDPYSTAPAVNTEGFFSFFDYEGNTALERTGLMAAQFLIEGLDLTKANFPS